MMTGDDIRNLRIKAGKDASFEDGMTTNPDYFPAQINLSLWVIAEQLFEIRALLGVALDRKPVTILVKSGSVEGREL